MSGVLQALLAGFGGAATDEYFEYVTMLLPGNGTNGAQNNTFLDSSTNNFTITRNGNTTQGTFTPYGSNWSNYFDGSGDTLSAPDNAALEFGSGNFTIEAFFYTTSTSNQTIIAKWATSNLSWFLGFGSGLGFYINVGAGGVLALPLSSVPANQWNHIAVTRSGADLKLFLNGTQSGSTYNIGSSTILDTSATVVVAGDGSGNPEFVGYISNVRILKGTAQYTSNFTPPTTPLTAITNTSLLTCQSNRFIDNSSNAFAITVNGDTSVQRFSPFNPTTPYAADVIGGSGYYDGNGDYLSVTNSNDFDTNTSFTLECWIYTNSNGCMFGRGGGSASWSTTDGHQFIFYISSGVLRWQFNSGGSPVTLDSSAIPLNSWVHCAVGYNGTTTRLWLNGVSAATSTSSYTMPTTRNIVRSGLTASGDQPYTGYISGLRFVKSDVYGVGNTTITLPTAPLTAITNTSLLLSYTNGGIIDNAMMNDLETVGNAQISTSVSKFGGGSLAFDGTGDYLLAPSSVNWDFGTGDFTVEFWINFNSVGNDTIIGKWGSGAGKYAWVVQVTSSNLIFYTGNNGTLGTQYTFAWSAATSTWYHVAVTRNGTSLRAFINGTQIGTTQTNSDSLTASGAFCCIGENLDGGGQGGFVDGYIDDLRITKGYARYTGNFTAPSGPFPLQ